MKFKLKIQFKLKYFQFSVFKALVCLSLDHIKGQEIKKSQTLRCIK